MKRVSHNIGKQEQVLANSALGGEQEILNNRDNGMGEGKPRYSLSSTGLLIDIRDIDLVSGDETAEEQKLNPCGCDVWCICRTEKSHTEQICQE